MRGSFLFSLESIHWEKAQLKVIVNQKLISGIYDIAQPAKLVMKNVKFEFFGMQMYSLINIVYGDVELSNVEFHSIIILAYIYTPF